LGAGGYSDYTIHKDESERENILNATRNVKIGKSQALALQVIIVAGCYGSAQH
jgi:hypothetical protein